ncbi:MAG TPA: hypothetical protein VM537_18740 [Anaerolineae bacterium]|nr:hypothetical protein [Anaerolineae bacterium]
MRNRAQEVLDLLGLKVGDEIFVSMGAGYGGNERILGAQGDWLIVKPEGRAPPIEKTVLNVQCTHCFGIPEER